MNTIVVCSVHREPKVKPFIEDLNPQYSYTGDYPGRAGGFYRCTMGHITGLAAYKTDEVALVFEDDCIPNPNKNWRGAIVEAEQLILNGLCDIVCLHGRGEEQIPNRFKFEKYKNFEWGTPPPTPDYNVNGSLAYMINTKAAWELRRHDPWYMYTPLDCLLWTPRFNYLLLKDNNWAQMHFIHGCGTEESLMRLMPNHHYSLV